MKKFEYLQIDRTVNPHELNELGEEGWELVSHSTSIQVLFFFQQLYIFKREKK